MKTKRYVGLTMFDFLKGLAMIGVMIRHSIAWPVEGTIIWRILYSVMMPIFFMTSGFWLKKKKFRDGLKASVQYLLVPYLIVIGIIDGIGLVHRILIHNLSEWRELFLVPSILVKSGEYTRVGPMWFVFALFVAWCIFYLVIQIKNEKIQIILAVFTGIIGGCLMRYKLPFQISQGMLAFFILYAGYMCKKKKLLEIKIPPYIYALLIVGWGISIYYGTMDMSTYNVKNGIFTAVGSLCGVFIFIRFFLHLNMIESKITDAAKWLGRYSMWILCIHSIEAAVVPWKVLFKVVDQYSVMGCAVQFILRFLLVIAVCQMMIHIQKSYIKRRNKRI